MLGTKDRIDNRAPVSLLFHPEPACLPLAVVGTDLPFSITLREKSENHQLIHFLIMSAWEETRSCPCFFYQNVFLGEVYLKEGSRLHIELLTW